MQIKPKIIQRILSLQFQKNLMWALTYSGQYFVLFIHFLFISRSFINQKPLTYLFIAYILLNLSNESIVSDFVTFLHINNRIKSTNLNQLSHFLVPENETSLIFFVKSFAFLLRFFFIFSQRIHQYIRYIFGNFFFHLKGLYKISRYKT